MANYENTDIDFIIREPEFTRLWKNAENLREHTWITTLWLTGARPQELLEMKKKDIEFIEPNIIKFRIKTKKLGTHKKFIIRTRNLKLLTDLRERHIYKMRQYLRRFKSPESKIFPFSRKTGYNIIQKVGYKALSRSLCPYNFRHSRMTLLAEMGYSEEKMMRFKGCLTKQSVKPYNHAREVNFTVEADYDDEKK